MMSVCMRLVGAIALCVLSETSSVAETRRGAPQIVDADTVYLGSTKIRLRGIDAPETDQLCLDSNGRRWSCGIEARTRLEAHSNGRIWVCQLHGLDFYGRHLGSCTIDGNDVSSWLVRSGWALAFRRYSNAYTRDEAYAREERNGLWSGAFIAPWDWRKRNTQTVGLGALSVAIDAQRTLIAPAAVDTPPSPSCIIKANLQRRDQCIYHLPGGRYYELLKMQPTGSRRWFCTEAEAQAAGCRRSKV